MMRPSDRLRAISFAEQMKAQLPFRHRGLSDRTIQALVEYDGNDSHIAI
jgi:hypothetical protein